MARPSHKRWKLTSYMEILGHMTASLDPAVFMAGPGGTAYPIDIWLFIAILESNGISAKRVLEMLGIPKENDGCPTSILLVLIPTRDGRKNGAPAPKTGLPTALESSYFGTLKYDVKGRWIDVFAAVK
jgi:hypothetical protein